APAWPTRRTRPPPQAVPGAYAANIAATANPCGEVQPAACSSLASLVDQRAGTLIGEQLEQDRVLHLAVDDDDALHALLERIDAGLDLWDHAARNRAVGDQLARVLDREIGDQLLRLVEHAGDVGQEQQPFCLQRARDRAGKGVGVDVESLP